MPALSVCRDRGRAEKITPPRAARTRQRGSISHGAANTRSDTHAPFTQRRRALERRATNPIEALIIHEVAALIAVQLAALREPARARAERDLESEDKKRPYERSRHVPCCARRPSDCFPTSAEACVVPPDSRAFARSRIASIRDILKRVRVSHPQARMQHKAKK